MSNLKAKIDEAIKRKPDDINDLMLEEADEEFGASGNIGFKIRDAGVFEEEGI
jgi:hypothetical protein